MVDEGVGPVVATPIMRWLHDVDGPVEQFNQTVVVQTPAESVRPTWWLVLQALLDRHAMLAVAGRGRRCRGMVAAGARSRGRCDAGDCVPTCGCVVRCGVGGGAVAVGSGGRGDAQRAVGGRYRPVGVDRSPSGGRWGVLANPVGRPQYCLGPASQRRSRWRCRRAGRRLPDGRRCWPSMHAAARWWSRPTRGGRWRRPRRAAAGGAAGSGYLCQRRATVGVTGCRDHPAG